MVLPLASFVIAVAANLGLAMLVLRRNYQSATNTLFALLALILAAWSTVNYISFVTTDYALALWTIRLVFASAVLQSITFAMLLKTLPRSTIPFSRKSLLLISSLTFLGLVITLSPYLVTSIELRAGLVPLPIFTWGLAIFVPLTIGSLIWGTFVLIKNNISAKGAQKNQQRYVLLGLVITFGLLISLILFMAVVKKDTRFVPYAPLFTLPFVAATSYAIIRHRLMDIKAAIARSISLSILIGAVLLIYGALLVFAVPVIADMTGLRGDLIAAIAALASIPLAKYVQLGLRKLTDRFLFQNRINYQAELVRIGEDLSRTIKIDDVTGIILKAMSAIIRTRTTIIFLRDEQTQELIPHATAGTAGVHVTLPADHPLVMHLTHASGPLVKDELALTIEQETSPRHIKELTKVNSALTWLDASVAIPLFVNEKLTGLIIIGDKLSGEPYLHDDVNFLSALAPQAAVALENAHLYQQSQEFGQKLEVEVKRATHELAQANQQLKDLDKAKSEFLSIASHQLYTPLTALRGYLSMLKEGDYGPPPAKQKPIIDILEKSATRLIELIKNLLDISRIESGRLELNLQIVDLAELANELVVDLMPQAMNKNLDLEFIKPTVTIPPVIADQERLRQVMLNFIDNAIKYTNQGNVKVYLASERNEVVFSVTDTGKGLSESEIAKLFTKFTRVGGSSRFNTEGTGLGLYVAKQIISEHRGEVDVTSPGKNQGSTFSMRLPAAGTTGSLKVGQPASVTIKAAEVA